MLKAKITCTRLLNGFLSIAGLILSLSAHLLSYEIAEKRLAQPHFLPPDHIVFSIESRNGLFLFTRSDGSLVRISAERGSGRYFSVSEEQRTIAFKEVTENEGIIRQRACIYSPFSREQTFQSAWYPLCGNPSVSSNGSVAFSVDSTLIVYNDKGRRSTNVGSYSNLSPISHNGCYFVCNDKNDQLWIYGFDRYEKICITNGNLGFAHPSWSPDDSMILFASLSGELYIYFFGNDSVRYIGTGCHQRWVDNKQVIYVKQEVEHYTLVNSDIAIYDLAENKTTIFQTPGELETEPFLFESHLFYISLVDGGLHEAELGENNILSARKLIVREQIPLCGEKKSRKQRANCILNIPYMHQLYDTKDEFHGGWACGPTSCVMAIQTYNMLPNWGTVCSGPYQHMSLFGRYISDIYTYNGITYDWMSYDPNSSPAYGAYGYICPAGAAVWANMEQYIVWHGVTSYMDVTPTWSEFLPEIDNAYPVVVSTQLTAAGHIILAKGYVENQHTLISNDPYGDKNLGYCNYFGSGAFYDWPGYNNGYENLNQVKVFIGAQYDFPQNVRIFDDLDTVFSYKGSWLERSGGYDMHAYYTSALEQGDSAFWKISIIYPDTISVFTEFYRGGDRVRNARYFVRHKDGIAAITVDQRGYGLSGWYELGAYWFEDSIIIGATDTGSDSSGIILADAVMLVFHNVAGIEHPVPSFWHNGCLKVSPNPFSSSVSISLDTYYGGQSAKGSELKIYDVSGTFVTSLLIAQPEFPLSIITWDGTDSNGKRVRNGIYFLSVKNLTSNKTLTKKIIKIE